MGTKANLVSSDQKNDIDQLIRETDPFFEIDHNKDLVINYKPTAFHADTVGCIVAGIKRNPGNLHQHIQRINLSLQSLDSKKIEAALVDLFIALGSSGADLKNRILNQLKPHLTTSAYDFFQQHSQSGLTPDDYRVGNIAGSVLSEGFIGQTQLVIESQVES